MGGPKVEPISKGDKPAKEKEEMATLMETFQFASTCDWICLFIGET